MNFKKVLFVRRLDFHQSPERHVHKLGKRGLNFRDNRRFDFAGGRSGRGAGHLARLPTGQPGQGKGVGDVRGVAEGGQGGPVLAALGCRSEPPPPGAVAFKSG